MYRLFFSLFVLNTVTSPYYIWLGRSRSCDVSQACHAFEVEGGNLIGNCSPVLLHDGGARDSVPPLEIGEPAIDIEERNKSGSVVIEITPPLSTFHYQVSKVCVCCVLLVLLPTRPSISRPGVYPTMSNLFTRISGPISILSHG